jgi:cation transport regulator ChaC
MAELVTVPSEPTIEMYTAYLKAIGINPEKGYGKGLITSIRKHAGTTNEPGIVTGIRAAIAVGGGLPLDQVKRGWRPAGESGPGND